MKEVRATARKLLYYIRTNAIDTHDFNEDLNKFLMLIALCSSACLKIKPLKTDCIDDSLLAAVITSCETIKRTNHSPTFVIAACILAGEDPLEFYTFDGLDDECGFYPFSAILKVQEYVDIKEIIKTLSIVYGASSEAVYTTFQTLDAIYENKDDVTKNLYSALTTNIEEYKSSDINYAP